MIPALVLDNVACSVFADCIAVKLRREVCHTWQSCMCRRINNRASARRVRQKREEELHKISAQVGWGPLASPGLQLCDNQMQQACYLRKAGAACVVLTKANINPALATMRGLCGMFYVWWATFGIEGWLCGCRWPGWTKRGSS